MIQSILSAIRKTLSMSQSMLSMIGSIPGAIESILSMGESILREVVRTLCATESPLPFFWR
jgi:uncharacterized membrane protein AbrB (regulator of aidB expression)